MSSVASSNPTSTLTAGCVWMLVAPGPFLNSRGIKAEANPRLNFGTTTVREQHPRSHHQGATSKVTASLPLTREGPGSQKMSSPPDIFSSQRHKVADEPAPSWELRSDGWGYCDTEFELTEKGQITLKGARYPFSGMVFPHFRPWIEKVLGINIEDRLSLSPAKAQDAPQRNEPFIADLQACSLAVSFTDADRLFHAHGHTCQEIYALRFGKLHRIPDAVVWPSGHAEVEVLVRLAGKHNVVLIPFGGGTSVSGALECPADERRMIVSVDMHRMNKILWVDKENLLVCMEAGIVGQDIKRRLEKLGLTIGHEPDSIEFSSLGALRATVAACALPRTHAIGFSAPRPELGCGRLFVPSLNFLNAFCGSRFTRCPFSQCHPHHCFAGHGRR